MPNSSVPTPKFGCTVLGSGSLGNATVIHGPEGNLLVDEGFSSISVCRRLEIACVDPASIHAILITHAHVDHVSKFGCAKFADKLGLPVYFLPESVAKMEKDDIHRPKNTILFEPGSAFDLCGIHIESFAVSHDIPAVGFAFSVLGYKIGYATDLGFVSESVKAKLCGCDLLVLESNYDTIMLRTSRRKPELKRRIASNFGHLGNTQSMNALKDLLAPNTKRLVLAHISRDCNNPELLEDLTKKCLAGLQRDDVSLAIARQDAPLDSFWLE